MTESTQITLTAITLRVGKMAAYKSVTDKMETLVPAVKAGTISPAELLIQIMDHVEAELESLKND
jgi:hypothetical protein